MAGLALDSAERQLIELLRGSEPDKLHLAIHRSSLDGWEIEMSFEVRDKDDRTLQRIDSGAGPSFAEAWEKFGQRQIASSFTKSGNTASQVRAARSVVAFSSAT